MLASKEVRLLERKFSPGLKRLFQYYATGSPANTVSRKGHLQRLHPPRIAEHARSLCHHCAKLIRVSRLGQSPVKRRSSLSRKRQAAKAKGSGAKSYDEINSMMSQLSYKGYMTAYASDFLGTLELSKFDLGDTFISSSKAHPGSAQVRVVSSRGKVVTPAN